MTSGWGRLVVTPCEAFDNFPPGLPGQFAHFGHQNDLGARVALRALRVRWLRRDAADVRLDGPAAGAGRRSSGPGRALADARIRRDLMTYASGHQDRATNIASTEALARFGRPARVIWTDNRVMPREHGPRLAELLGADWSCCPTPTCSSARTPGGPGRRAASLLPTHA